MNDTCWTQQVTLQENGIIRNANGEIIGHLVENIDAMCDIHYERGRLHEREACAKLCENGAFLHDQAPDALFGRAVARAIRGRTE